MHYTLSYCDLLEDSSKSSSVLPKCHSDSFHCDVQFSALQCDSLSSVRSNVFIITTKLKGRATPPRLVELN